MKRFMAMLFLFVLILFINTVSAENFNIPSGPLKQVLEKYADITGKNPVYMNKLVEGKKSPGVKGDFSAEDAMAKILDGTGLDYVVTSEGRFVLKKRTFFSKLFKSSKALKSSKSEPVEMGTLIVYDKKEQDFDNTLQNVESLDEDALQAAGAADIKTATRYISGVDVFRAHKRGQSSGFNIRGIGAGNQGASDIGENRVLMTIDGERLPDYFNFGHDTVLPMVAGRDNVDFDTIKRMDVIKGPQSAKYGSDGIGGAVNFRTYDPEDFVNETKTWYAGAKYGYHSANKQHKGAVTLAGKKGIASALLIASKTDAREYSAYKKTEPWDVVVRKRRTRDPQWIKGHNILGKVHIGNEIHRLSLLGETYRKEYDTMLLSGGEAGLYPPPGATDTIRRRRVSLGYSIQPQNRWLDTLKMKIYNQNLHNSNRMFDDHHRFYSDPAKRRTDTFGDYEQNIWAGKVDLNGEFNTRSLRHGWAAGVQYRGGSSDWRQEYHRYTPGSGTTIETQKMLPEMRTRTLAAYVQDSIIFPFGITITPGVRYERWRYKAKADADYLLTNPDNGARLADGTMDNTTLCPKLRLSYPFTNHITGYGSIAWGEKNPSLQLINGMVRPGHIPILPGTDLKPEKTRNHEVGVLYNSQNLDISLVGFYNVYHDMFVYDIELNHPVFGFGIIPSNHDKVDIYGGEASIEWRFLPDWFVRGSVSYAKGTRDKSNFSQWVPPSSLDSNWSTTEPLQGVIGLGYDNEKIGVNLNCFMSKPYQQDFHLEDLDTPGFAVFDITGWWKLSEKIEINAGIYNLFDKKYWQGIDLTAVDVGISQLSDIHIEKYTMPGINFNVGLKIHF
ncbi:MAG: hypothetical protein CSA42_00215 [Gammaproteobacteria bacterium]|nr:MAG: hypothetical protein CSA42_00215 [Gammaproteobacteria bacterium]